jgi:hypothetical protein
MLLSYLRQVYRTFKFRYLFSNLFSFFSPFYIFASSFIFWRPVILYIYFFFSPVLPSFCYILLLVLFFPSLHVCVLFFISLLLSLHCCIISCFFLCHVLIFLFISLFLTFLRNLRRAGLRTSGRNKHVYCDIGYLDRDTFLPFSLFYHGSPSRNAAVLAIYSSSAASNIRRILSEIMPFESDTNDVLNRNLRLYN